MTTTMPRELLSCELTHGGKCLAITTRTGKKKATATYLVETGNGCVRLLPANGEPYEVTRLGCTCPNWRFVGRKTFDWCKHRIALSQVGLLPPVTEPERDQP